MEVVVVILLAAVILAVVIDMAMRMERRPQQPGDPMLSTTQKIIVDLKKRR
jgi:hypothetical protein